MIRAEPWRRAVEAASSLASSSHRGYSVELVSLTMTSFHCILEQQQSHRTAQLIRAVKRTWYVCDLWCFDTDSCLDLRRWRHHLETLTDSLCYRVVVVYSNDGQWRFRTFWRKLNCLQVTALRCDMHPNPLRENSPPDVTPCSGIGRHSESER